jgi:intracellular sulfur oxidation DsrE/DsrF family protein
MTADNAPIERRSLTKGTLMAPSHSPLRIVLHAPTAHSFKRAKSNAANVLRDVPDAQIQIVVNAEGVADALEAAPDAADPLVFLCMNTLRKLEKEAPNRFNTVPSAIVAVVELQQRGWIYVRA